VLQKLCLTLPVLAMSTPFGSDFLVESIVMVILSSPFILMKQEGGLLTFLLSNKTVMYKAKGKEKIKHQSRFNRHVFISVTHLFFVLWITKENSFLKFSLHFWTLGSSLLKM
jgi:hypothetical protein